MDEEDIGFEKEEFESQHGRPQPKENPDSNFYLMCRGEGLITKEVRKSIVCKQAHGLPELLDEKLTKTVLGEKQAAKEQQNTFLFNLVGNVIFNNIHRGMMGLFLMRDTNHLTQSERFIVVTTRSETGGQLPIMLMMSHVQHHVNRNGKIRHLTPTLQKNSSY